MYLFFETIKIVDGVIYNLDYHQFRVDKTMQLNFSEYSVLKLRSIISVPSELMHGLVRCRIEYNNLDYNIHYSRYIPRQINSLKLLRDDTINYNFKYSDRKDFIRLMENRGNCDDILIVKNSRITDTSFSNIIFQGEDMWYTPASPLLKGTTRSRLLSQGRIYEREILVDDLSEYGHFKLINSMLNDDFTDKTPLSAIVI